MVKVALNGLGRTGMNVLRSLIEDGFAAEIVLLNDKSGGAADHARRLASDRTQRKWSHAIEQVDDTLRIGEHRMQVTQMLDPEALPLEDLGVDLMIDCTGAFKTPEAVSPYFARGVIRVLLSAPIRAAPALNVAYGVNDHLYEPERHALITASSYAANCVAPVVKVLHEAIGLRHGSVTMLRNVYDAQMTEGAPTSDPAQAPSVPANVTPTSTDTAVGIGLIYPDLAGLVDGHAIYAPLSTASLTDCVFELACPATVAEINDLMRAASTGALSGVLGYEDRPFASADLMGDPRSAVVDAARTMVMGGTQLKLYAWCDLDYAYSCRVADIARMIVGRCPLSQ